MKIDILYEDDYCICVNKPHDVLVHHGKFSRNNADENSLLQLLEQQFGEKYYPVHRLDRRTSGVILLARQTTDVATFQKLFTDQEIQKTYYAVVRGFAPEQQYIDSPVKGKDAKAYKDAITELTLLKTISLDIPVGRYDTSRYSLVKLAPKTGRMHQLRIHMKKISHPIIGDGKYGDHRHDAMYVEQFGWKNLFLHAGSLSFTHPFSQEVLHINAPFSEDWNALFLKFGWRNPIGS
ncbi:pseudouridine synthase [Flavobacteriaceae bacterium S356]|uniref:tRNA pseudouridine synthase C n=1 Tax=Asprobacillus argus TaxID=3076534 RepID=A0ABU3LE05_9FLAO|nr:pseudouridine synthase [Flavobacteriaceae bacterium S356]